MSALPRGRDRSAPQSLSILFTNNTLLGRAGSELWVRDVCSRLVARGHRPVAFSLLTGTVAEELRAATVPVVSDLSNVAFTPDLIHGHHHVETLIAALHFPGVPIVHFCHGWLPWEEEPLQHPSVGRYVAVDETCVDRLTTEHGIRRDQVDLLLNFVDLKRFVARDPLPPRPRKALVLSNAADEHGYTAIIREACRESGIELDVVGMRSGRAVEHPEKLLPAFDLVFAKARSALEAMAVGCSVILADIAGCGPLVTERDFDRMRAGNFGVRWLQNAHSVDWYRAQINAYDAAEAGRISTRVREGADLETAVDRLVDIYLRTLTEHQRNAPGDASTAHLCADAQRAAARHVTSLARRLKGLQDDVRAHSAERETLRTRLETITNEGAALLTRVEAITNEREALRTRVATITNERDALLQLVAEYRSLPSLRLRDRLLRLPILGGTAQRAARWFSGG